MSLDPIALVAVVSALAAGVCIGIGSIGSALGEGRALAQAMTSLAQQPGESPTLTRTLFVGMAMVESTVIYAFVVAMVLIFANPYWEFFLSAKEGPLEQLSWLAGISIAGSAFCMGVGSIGSALGEGRALASCLESIADQPDEANTLVRTLFVGMAMVESTAIYTFVVAMIFILANPFWDYLLAAKPGPLENLFGVAAFSTAGSAFSIGIGSIAAAWGEGRALARCLRSISRQPDEANALVRTLFVGMAMVESTAIFCFVVSIVLLFANPFWNELITQTGP